MAIGREFEQHLLVHGRVESDARLVATKVPFKLG